MQVLPYALPNDLIEAFLKEIALLPFAHPGFAEYGVFRDSTIQLESAKPAIGDIKPKSLYQPPLRFETVQISK